jgi:hypothetical protein
MKSPTKIIFFGPSVTLLVCHFMLFFMGCSPKTTNDGEVTFVFEDVSVIDAINGFRAGQNVIVRGNRIIEVGPTGKIKKPSNSTTIDCRGKYLIPGLWDAHVHLTNSETLTPAMFLLFIVNGITYIRDTSGHLDLLLPLREEASLSEGMAPRVFITGPHIDGLQISWNSSVSAISPERARTIVDSLINAGVDQIKVYELIPPDIYFEVLSVARSRGFKVSAHVPLGMDVIEASNAGLGSIEHLNNLEMACSADFDSLLKARQQMIAAGSKKSGGELREEIYRAQRLHAVQTQDEERRNTVLKTLADNNTWQVPTLAIVTSAEYRIFARDDWRKTFRYLPEPNRSEWEKSAIRMTERPASEVELAHANWAYDIVPRFVEAGIGIMAGTDSPLALLTPGFSLHEELVLLVRAGLTPMQALEAATLRPAQFLGLEKQQGTIAKGMLADLVILDANPLEDIANTQRIRAVMRDGHLHTREALDKMLAQLEQ